jgi:hypothetical protein
MHYFNHEAREESRRRAAATNRDKTIDRMSRINRRRRPEQKRVAKTRKRRILSAFDRPDLSRRDAPMQFCEIYKEKVLGTIKGRKGFM